MTRLFARRIRLLTCLFLALGVGCLSPGVSKTAESDAPWLSLDLRCCEPDFVRFATRFLASHGGPAEPGAWPATIERDRWGELGREGETWLVRQDAGTRRSLAQEYAIRMEGSFFQLLFESRRWDYALFAVRFIFATDGIPEELDLDNCRLLDEWWSVASDRLDWVKRQGPARQERFADACRELCRKYYGTPGNVDKPWRPIPSWPDLPDDWAVAGREKRPWPYWVCVFETQLLYSMTGPGYDPSRYPRWAMRLIARKGGPTEPSSWPMPWEPEAWCKLAATRLEWLMRQSREIHRELSDQYDKMINSLRLQVCLDGYSLDGIVGAARFIEGSGGPPVPYPLPDSFGGIMGLAKSGLEWLLRQPIARQRKLNREYSDQYNASDRTAVIMIYDTSGNLFSKNWFEKEAMYLDRLRKSTGHPDVWPSRW